MRPFFNFSICGRITEPPKRLYSVINEQEKSSVIVKLRSEQAMSRGAVFIQEPEIEFYGDISNAAEAAKAGQVVYIEGRVNMRKCTSKTGYQYDRISFIGYSIMHEYSGAQCADRQAQQQDEAPAPSLPIPSDESKDDMPF